jgi:hypothetical protein
VLALVAAHLVVAGLLPLVSARSTRAAFGVAAVLPARGRLRSASCCPSGSMRSGSR